MSADTVTIKYGLRLNSGAHKTHVVLLDSVTMGLRNSPPANLPGWTQLKFHQCPNCPLDATKQSHCPVAVGLVNVIESFKNDLSHEVADVTVTTPQRTYVKRAALQEVISSLMGLHMATSGCPILDKLRPMVYTHLPFASIEETLYRAISTYLLAQYIRWKQGLMPDWELQNLVSDYDAVSEVNLAFAKRILHINTLDANMNALASLDCFAGMASLSIAKNYLSEIEPLFGANPCVDQATANRAA